VEDDISAAAAATENTEAAAAAALSSSDTMLPSGAAEAGARAASATAALNDLQSTQVREATLLPVHVGSVASVGNKSQIRHASSDGHRKASVSGTVTSSNNSVTHAAAIVPRIAMKKKIKRKPFVDDRPPFIFDVSINRYYLYSY
jgi:Cu/Ag efflux pump CusA